MMWKKMSATQAGSTISVKMRSLFSYCEAYMDGDARARMLMPQVMELNESKNEKPFFPSGAIFFFALLLFFYAGLWLVIYWIMIARS